MNNMIVVWMSSYKMCAIIIFIVISSEQICNPRMPVGVIYTPVNVKNIQFGSFMHKLVIVVFNKAGMG